MISDDDSNNNNLSLMMVKTNRWTLHTVYNIQQSAMQGSNDTTHRLSRRTAATTRFSPKGIECQKHNNKVLPTSDRVGLYLASIHKMAPPEHTSDKQACYSFIDPGKMTGW